MTDDASCGVCNACSGETHAHAQDWSPAPPDVWSQEVLLVLEGLSAFMA